MACVTGSEKQKREAGMQGAAQTGDARKSGKEEIAADKPATHSSHSGNFPVVCGRRDHHVTACTAERSFRLFAADTSCSRLQCSKEAAGQDELLCSEELGV
ncbi:hypothetical protein CIHG_01950 [Coccidioides immitis H538.4]|uniref:Uncharacterized protein n=3 Tax=Coccidioides immitis TaxID=5501 RepID=A0A0J8QN02_COCIT|nr:hypothetical protein CIRG_06275 [Coccidioides immitis RMSCC 2394]KMU73735.1 hypothetical protein CISG_03785 [Coccidioides immitis RMSCC 3703]KMU84164.1 hypothetical protein CIHG_01950 [Coccidioides immitis H538.4]